MTQASGGLSSAELVSGLRARRHEIEEATLTRMYAISEPPSAAGPEYAEGLRAAVTAGVEYGLSMIERGERRAPPVPEALLAQARLAARSGVSLDTVLRRCLASHSLFDDFLIEESERQGLPEPTELKRLLRSQVAIVDRLLAAASKAYAEEAERRPWSAERRRIERIERLLAGELVDTEEIVYDFRGWHLGLLVSGAEGADTLADLARSLDCRLLSIRREKGVIWAWLGSKRRLDSRNLEGLASRHLPGGLSLAVGEPAKGLAGWRLTHRQARAALQIALRSNQPVVRYAKVALLASMLHDDVLVASLRELYLEPLSVERDGGAALRATLSAYFQAESNMSSAAAALGVSRQTVSRRLATIEALVGRSLGECGTEIEAALWLDTHGLAAAISAESVGPAVV